MTKVNIRFVDSSKFEYTTQDIQEPNKIRHCIENNIPLPVLKGNTTVYVIPQNITFLEIKEEVERIDEPKGIGILIRCVECGKFSTVKTNDFIRNVCNECKGDLE